MEILLFFMKRKNINVRVEENLFHSGTSVA